MQLQEVLHALFLNPAFLGDYYVAQHKGMNQNITDLPRTDHQAELKMAR